MMTPIDRELTAPAAYTPFGGYARLNRLTKGLDNSDRRSIVWLGVLIAGSIAAMGTLWLDGFRLPPPWAILVLVAVAVVGDWQVVAVTERAKMSASFLPLVFAAVVFGPVGGFAVGALSNAFNASDIRESRLKWSVYTPIRGLTAAAAGLSVRMLVPSATGFGDFLLESLIAAVVGVVAEGLLSGVTAAVRGLSAMRQLWAAGPALLLTVPLYVPILSLFVYGYQAYSLPLVVIFFVPTIGAQRLLHLY